MTFGERLRELRKAKGLYQKELADKVGVDFTYLSRLENDRRRPPKENTISALAEVLEVDPDELLALAKRIPADLADKLGLETIQMLRSATRPAEKPADWGRPARKMDKRKPKPTSKRNC
jgi:transcriptional regulator with XRE-family HTH domain